MTLYTIRRAATTLGAAAVLALATVTAVGLPASATTAHAAPLDGALHAVRVPVRVAGRASPQRELARARGLTTTAAAYQVRGAAAPCVARPLYSEPAPVRVASGAAPFPPGGRRTELLAVAAEPGASRGAGHRGPPRSA